MKKNIKLIPLFLFLFVFQLLYFLSTIYTEKIDHIFLILAVFMIQSGILYIKFFTFLHCPLHPDLPFSHIYLFYTFF